MKDGNSWFSLRLYTMERAKHQSQIAETSEIVHIIYTDANSNERDAEFFGIGALVSNGTGIPIVPHSWYHVCLGLDTVSGLLRIVVNGVEVVNEEKNYFRNSADVKPKSLAEKLLVFKEHHIGVYLNNRGMFTNMNIFGSMMSVDAMIQRTSGGESCFDPGDYLRYVWFKKVLVNQSSIFAFSWEDMKWNVTGNVLAGTTDSVEVCHK